MDIIDAHLHFMPQDRYFGETAAAAGEENTLGWLQAAFNRAGISHGVVMGNRGLALAAHDYPPFLSYCIGLDREAMGPGLKQALPLVEAHLQRPGCVGVKLYPGYNEADVTAPAYTPVYELAARFGKPVAIHTGATAGPQAYLKYCRPLLLDTLAVNHPRTLFVMCHYGNPFLAEAAAVVGKNPNVCADLSGLLEGRVDVDRLFQNQGHYIAQLQGWIEYLGAYDKLMFGTDWPLADHAGYVEFIKRIIPEAHWEAVFARNARRIYGLPDR